MQTGGLLAALVFVSAVALSPAPAAIGETRCFENWSEAVQVVHREKLVSARELQSWARKRLRGDVVRVTLCADGDRFVYRLLIRDPRGRITSRVVDAHRPGNSR